MTEYRSFEEICAEKERRLHLLIRDLDIWNRTVYTGFLRFTQYRDWEEFSMTISDRLQYLHVPEEYIRKWESIKMKGPTGIDIYEIAEFLNSVRRWIISEMDRLIREACEECSRIITLPPKEYKRTPREIIEEPLREKEEELSPEEREVLERKKEEKKEEEEEEEEEEKEYRLKPVEIQALPPATMSTVEAIFEKLKKEDLLTHALKEVKDKTKKEEILSKMKEIHLKVLQSVNFRETFPETVDDADQIVRYLKGLIILAENRLVDMEADDFAVEAKTDKGYKVTITVEKAEYCECKDYQRRHQRCKHIYALIQSMFIDYWKYTGEVTEE